MISFMLISCKDIRKHVVKSPSGDIALTIQLDEQTNSAYYDIVYNGEKVLNNSALGMALKNNADLCSNLTIASVKTSSVNTTWTPVFGEKSIYPENYNQSVIKFEGKEDDQFKFTLQVRAYNEGVAFRYESDMPNDTVVKEELTTFNVSNEASLWTASHAQGAIKKSKLADIKTEVERPVLVQSSDTTFLAIGEANLVDFARRK